MDPGGVDRVDGVDAGQDGRDEGAGQLVDEHAEGRIFLRGAADAREGPDGALAVVDALDAEDGEVVGEAVIAEVVAEGALTLAMRSGSIVPMMTKSASAGIGRPPRGSATIRTRRPPRAPAKLNSGRPSGRGMTAATVRAGGPPTKTLTRRGSPRRIAAAWWTPIPRWIW